MLSCAYIIGSSEALLCVQEPVLEKIDLQFSSLFSMNSRVGQVDVGIFIFNRCSHRAIIILALFGILSSLSMQTSMSSFSTEASTESITMLYSKCWTCMGDVFCVGV